MSLYFYLESEPTAYVCHECGSNVNRSAEIFSRNITHNLNKMAEEAGIYNVLWRPDENGITKASQCIEPLKLGLSDLKNRPGHFMLFNAHNGWGMYEHFVPFVEAVLDACVLNKDANVRVSR